MLGAMSESKRLSAVGRSPTDSEWAVISARHGTGRPFLFVVTSTGIVCTSGCPARSPARGRVRIVSGLDEGLAAGARPCMRCRPDRLFGASPTSAADPVQAAIARLTAALTSGDNVPTERELSGELQLPERKLRELFRRSLGVTLRAWLSARRAEMLRSRLANGQDVTAALYDAGYGSSSAAYEAANGELGMAPGRYRGGAPGESIRWTIAPIPEGVALVAATGRGLCAVRLGSDADALATELRAEFPRAALARDDAALAVVASIVADLAAGRRPGPPRLRPRPRERRRLGQAPRAETQPVAPSPAHRHHCRDGRHTNHALWPRPVPLPQGSGRSSSGSTRPGRHRDTAQVPCPAPRWRPRRRRSTNRSRRRTRRRSRPARSPDVSAASPRGGPKATPVASRPAIDGTVRATCVRAAGVRRTVRARSGHCRLRSEQPSAERWPLALDRRRKSGSRRRAGPVCSAYRGAHLPPGLRRARRRFEPDPEPVNAPGSPTCRRFRCSSRQTGRVGRCRVGPKSQPIRSRSGIGQRRSDALTHSWPRAYAQIKPLTSCFLL